MYSLVKLEAILLDVLQRIFSIISESFIPQLNINTRATALLILFILFFLGVECMYYGVNINYFQQVFITEENAFTNKNKKFTGLQSFFLQTNDLISSFIIHFTWSKSLVSQPLLKHKF